jgi:hypothetical protein
MSLSLSFCERYSYFLSIAVSLCLRSWILFPFFSTSCFRCSLTSSAASKAIRRSPGLHGNQFKICHYQLMRYRPKLPCACLTHTTKEEHFTEGTQGNQHCSHNAKERKVQKLTHPSNTKPKRIEHQTDHSTDGCVCLLPRERFRTGKEFITRRHQRGEQEPCTTNL